MAHTGGCGEALQISQLIQQGVPKDEYAVGNAQEMINICQQVADSTATPVVSLTGEPTGANPPAAGVTTTPTPAQ
jgi:hypothetical protein